MGHNLESIQTNITQDILVIVLVNDFLSLGYTVGKVDSNTTS